MLTAGMEKDTGEGLSLSDFKTYYKALEMKTVQYWQTAQWNRIV